MDLDRIIDRWRGPLVGLLGARGASPADAVELAQDAFSEAYLGRERFEGSWEDDGAVGAWLRGIALNLMRAGARRRSGGHRLTLVGDRDALDREAVDARPEAEAGPVLAAVGRLQESWREVLMMRYVEGSGLAEIGALLGIGERAVEGRLRRARTELRRLLESDGAMEVKS
ncbi:MAG: sigma-70 family RNA polymerase sigma factor [Planctomycetota bacterium]|jgi:RNA polymerase sigma-70 factor (ECF subfamily)